MGMNMTARATSDDFNLIPSPTISQDGIIRVRTAREICDTPDPPQSDLLLGPLIVRGARTIIVGDTGHGKTSLALQLATAVLNGQQALNYTGAGIGPALVVDLEQGERSIKRILRENRLESHDDVIYAAVPDGLELDANTKHREELERIVVNHQPAILILDPYYKAHRADSNEERAIVDLMRHLDELRTAYGFALILPAHPRKTPAGTIGTRQLSLGDVFGSSAVTRGAELVIALERLNHGYARLRFLKDRDHDLPIGETWGLLYSKEHGFTIDQKQESTQEQIEERLYAQDQAWRTLKEWRPILKVREDTAQATLDRLTEQGSVTFMVGPPGRSPQAKCWSTAPNLWSTPEHPGAPSTHTSTAPTAPTYLGSSQVGAPNNGGTTAPGALEHITAFLDTEPDPEEA
jgi:hypothetical protein